MGYSNDEFKRDLQQIDRNLEALGETVDRANIKSAANAANRSSSDTTAYDEASQPRKGLLTGFSSLIGFGPKTNQAQIDLHAAEKQRAQAAENARQAERDAENAAKESRQKTQELANQFRSQNSGFVPVSASIKAINEQANKPISGDYLWASAMNINDSNFSSLDKSGAESLRDAYKKGNPSLAEETFTLLNSITGTKDKNSTIIDYPEFIKLYQDRKTTNLNAGLPTNKYEEVLSNAEQAMKIATEAEKELLSVKGVHDEYKDASGTEEGRRQAEEAYRKGIADAMNQSRIAVLQMELAKNQGKLLGFDDGIDTYGKILSQEQVAEQRPQTEFAIKVLQNELEQAKSPNTPSVMELAAQADGYVKEMEEKKAAQEIKRKQAEAQDLEAFVETITPIIDKKYADQIKAARDKDPLNSGDEVKKIEAEQVHVKEQLQGSSILNREVRDALEHVDRLNLDANQKQEMRTQLFETAITRAADPNRGDDKSFAKDFFANTAKVENANSTPLDVKPIDVAALMKAQGLDPAGQYTIHIDEHGDLEVYQAEKRLKGELAGGEDLPWYEREKEVTVPKEIIIDLDQEKLRSNGMDISGFKSGNVSVRMDYRLLASGGAPAAIFSGDNQNVKTSITGSDMTPEDHKQAAESIGKIAFVGGKSEQNERRRDDKAESMGKYADRAERWAEARKARREAKEEQKLAAYENETNAMLGTLGMPAFNQPPPAQEQERARPS